MSSLFLVGAIVWAFYIGAALWVRFRETRPAAQFPRGRKQEPLRPAGAQTA